MEKRILTATLIVIGILFLQTQSAQMANSKASVIEEENKTTGNSQLHKSLSRENTRSEKLVALTIDDGYGDIASFVDVLNQNRVKATFFMVGEIAKTNPEGLKKIVDEGHLLANHSYNHPQFTTLNKDEILWQLNEGRELFKEVTGYDTYPYFRYPYGSHSTTSDAVLGQEGWKYFYWTQNTWDWAYVEDTQEGRDYIYNKATTNVPKESIVLLHTMSNSSLAILPEIISWYKRNGYQFVTVDQL
jgi:peptidoglycan/xylan/chitin deacetylase (PgdA/CDA1 family)